jgi:threonylcarbamoyladenosine tRNA methylthiotransferase MtaB
MQYRTCRLVTLGCKVNQYETQLVKEALARGGYREAADGESADLCVVNTCTVTGTGDAKSRQAIRQLARKNPGTRTVVMGCYATRDPQAVSRLPGVFEVVRDKRELGDVLGRLGIVDIPRGISHFEGRKRAYVKVQDGCLLKCTYCIIPHVRPGLASRSPADIEDEVRRLVGNGYREIVISGIHVGHYGVDTTRGKSGLPPFRLWHLFRQLDRIPGNWRMRLSSIEAAEMNEDFIGAAADCEHLCPQFHPALQSGSDRVLRRMRRRYSVGRFLETIERMRERLDRPAFATDMIVGFPGETEDDFEESLAACRLARFMKIHVFPYSAREGTKAAQFPDQLPPATVRRRVTAMSELDRELALAYYRSLEGSPLEVLVEQFSEERSNHVRGTDRRYVPVEVPGGAEDFGQFVYAVGEQTFDRHLHAIRVSSAIVAPTRERPSPLAPLPKGEGNRIEARNPCCSPLSLRVRAMGLLVAIEGIDGAGKGTQAARLVERLRGSGSRTELVSFPRYEATFFGRAVGEFLNGRFGSLEDVHPFLAATLFAGDRFESRSFLTEALRTHDLVVLDRYVGSNIAHQAAKLDGEERAALRQSIEHLEYGVFKMPRPDLVILLDLGVSQARKLIDRKAARTYTDRAADIQEADGDYLTRVRDLYLELAAGDSNWSVVPCERGGALRSVEEIADEIWRLVAGVRTACSPPS